jgi:hypothetical protein
MLDNPRNDQFEDQGSAGGMSQGTSNDTNDTNASDLPENDMADDDMMSEE